MAKKKNIKDVEESKIKTKAKKVKEEKEVKDLEEEEELEETEEIEEVEEDLESEDDEYEEVEDEESEDDDDYAEVKTDKKGKKKKSTKKKEGYFDLVGKELKKVVWPKGSEILKYSLAVIIFCVILCLFFEAVELLAAFLKGWLS